MHTEQGRLIRGLPYSSLLPMAFPPGGGTLLPGPAPQGPAFSVLAKRNADFVRVNGTAAPLRAGGALLVRVRGHTPSLGFL